MVKEPGVFPPTDDEGRPLCQGCQRAPAEPPHECPYKVEIAGDRETKCNCCSTCQYSCAMDI